MLEEILADALDCQKDEPRWSYLETEAVLLGKVDGSRKKRDLKAEMD